MNFVFDNNTPIYLQLVEQLKVYIISGQLTAGERLPSVRELALLCKANPNTVQKALAELEDIGLIYTERTNGKFVTDDSARIAAFRSEYAGALCAEFFEDMHRIGYDTAQTFEYLKERYK